MHTAELIAYLFIFYFTVSVSSLLARVKMNIFKKKMNTMICHNFNFLYLCYVKEFKKFTPMCREADRLHDNGHVIDCDFSHSGEGRRYSSSPFFFFIPYYSFILTSTYTTKYWFIEQG